MVIGVWWEDKVKEGVYLVYIHMRILLLLRFTLERKMGLKVGSELTTFVRIQQRVPPNLISLGEGDAAAHGVIETTVGVVMNDPSPSDLLGYKANKDKPYVG